MDELGVGDATAIGGVDESICGRRGLEVRENVVGDGEWYGFWRKRDLGSEAVEDLRLRAKPAVWVNGVGSVGVLERHLNSILKVTIFAGGVLFFLFLFSCFQDSFSL